LQAPEFSYVRFFDPDNNAALMLARTDSGWGVTRPDGSWQIEPKFEQLGQLVDGLAAARLDGHWGFIDAYGHFKIDPKYDYVYGFAHSAALTAARVDKGLA
jgi:WG containing repeat